VAASGVLEILERGGGFLRNPTHSFVPSREDAFVPGPLIARCHLIAGALVAGTARQEQHGLRLESV
jgi:transcription termination factor Rho